MTWTCGECGFGDGHENPAEAKNCELCGTQRDLPRGNWIHTYSGRQFYPFDPRAEDVILGDIAHALSNLCRFTGHVSQFYSVAEHSVHVSRLVPRRHALAGLLHDASEAYVADLSGPVKHSPELATYREVEAKVQAVILEAFGLPPVLPREVHEADRLMGALEARQLFLHFPGSWAEGLELPGFSVVGLRPGPAEDIFLDRFREITE